MKKTVLRVPFASLGSESLPLLAGISISAAVGIACFLATGTSLDLFLGSLMFAALLAPVLGMPAVVGFASVWLWPVFRGGISPVAWFESTLVLTSFVAAIVGAGKLLQQWKIHPIAASAIVTLASLAWLTWPIWLGASGPIAIHPLFAINAACKDLGIWTEQRMAYRLISLGQDTAYRFPGSVMPAVLFHAALASLFTAFNWITRKIQRTGAVAPCST